MRSIISLILLLNVPVLAWAQSDFKLSTATMPRLEDALVPLPPVFGDTVVREGLDAPRSRGPKPDEVLKQVVNGLKTRQFEPSLPKLEYLQSLRPSEPDILILRGCIYAESGHPDVAENLFRKAMLIAPAHPWARLNLAEAQMTQKKYGEAEANLTILSSTRPESEVVRFKLIIAYILQKKLGQAEQEMQYLEAHATTPAHYFARAAVAFSKGETKLGQELVDQAKKNFGEAQSSYFYNSIAGQGWVKPVQ